MIKPLARWLSQYANPSSGSSPIAPPRPARAVRLAVENLEDRTVPANIDITSVSLVNASDQALSSVTVGQAFYVQCTFTTQGLPSNASYDISYTVNGSTKTTGFVSWGAGNSGTGYWYMYWGTWTAAVGTNQISATVDATDSVAETTYADNTMNSSFTAIQPSIIITSLSLVNGNDQPITFVNAGQAVYVQATFTTKNLPTGASYSISYDVDGTVLTTGSLTWGDGASGTGYWYCYWGTFTAMSGFNWAEAWINVNEPYSTSYGVDSFTAANTNPTASTAYSAAPTTDTLFGPNGPSYLDVQQGAEGDCWLIGSLAEVAARNPQAIKNMFTYDGTAVENGSTVGLYTVRYYNTSNQAIYVTVDTELPSGGSYYDQPVNGVLWVALAEKAYVIANGESAVTTNFDGYNNYDALGNWGPNGGDGGNATWALQAITGLSTNSYSINPSNIATAWNNGEYVVFSTPKSETDSNIVGGHIYAMVGYNPSNAQSEPYELMNPWGDTSSGYAPGSSTIWGLLTCNGAFLSDYFNGYSTAGSADSADTTASTPGQFAMAEFGSGDAGLPEMGNLVPSERSNYLAVTTSPLLLGTDTTAESGGDPWTIGLRISTTANAQYDWSESDETFVGGVAVC